MLEGPHIMKNKIGKHGRKWPKASQSLFSSTVMRHARGQFGFLVSGHPKGLGNGTTMS